MIHDGEDDQGDCGVQSEAHALHYGKGDASLTAGIAQEKAANAD